MQKIDEKKNIWMWASAVLLCTTIGASYFALNYQYQNTRIQGDYEALIEDVKGLTLTINMMIDYGDGNVVWFNNTMLPLDINLLKALELLADIEYTTGEYGAFVEEVNGVGDDSTKFWYWFYLDSETGAWVLGPSAADSWLLHDGDVVSWKYSDG